MALPTTPSAAAPVVRELAEKHGTPLFVVYDDMLTRNYRVLSRLLGGVKVYYAVKANPLRPIVQRLLALGSSLDVSSLGELQLCQQLSLPASRALYTQPIKRPQEIELAKSLGLDRYVCDNVDEIAKVARYAPGAKVIIRVGVMNPYCVVNLSEKFGCEIDLLPDLVLYAADLGLEPHGVCFHVGSQTTSPAPFVDTLRVLRAAWDRLLSQGIELKFLDIGGGFPVSYLHPLMSIEEFCEPIRNTLQNLFGDCELACEPGRFLVGNACVFVTRVIGRSIRGHVPWYYIDDGLYGCFSGKLFDHADYPLFSEREGTPQPCMIAGPTCDSFDVPFKDRSMPELEIGDLLWATNVGAYTMASASEFNGFARPTCLFITRSGDHELHTADLLPTAPG